MKIVFPEGLDERILVAVNNLAGNKVLKPIVVGNKEDIQAKAKELNLTLDGVDILTRIHMKAWKNSFRLS